MFSGDAAFKWGKRRRLLRLPGEKRSDPSDYNVYEGSGQFYVLLAKSAGHLLSASDDPRAIRRSIRQALRHLMSGTSFLPSYTPFLPGEADVIELLQRVSEIVSRKVMEQTRFTISGGCWDAHRSSLAVWMRPHAHHSSM